MSFIYDLGKLGFKCQYYIYPKKRSSRLFFVFSGLSPHIYIYISIQEINGDNSPEKI